MTDKSKAYNLTDEHFERERAELNKIRSEMIAEQAHALEEFDRKFDRLMQLQADVAYLAERHAKPERTKPAEPEPITSGKARRSNAGRTRGKSIAKAKRPNTGRPYEPWENERILAAGRGTLEVLAADLDRDYPGVLKQHEVLMRLMRRQRKREKTDTPGPDRDGEARRSDESLPQRMEAPITGVDIEPSEKPEIFQPVSPRATVPPADVAEWTPTAARELAEFDGKLQRRPQPKPGVPVTGRLMDNGPEDRRVLDERAFASKYQD